MTSVGAIALLVIAVGCTAMPTEEAPTPTPTPPPQWMSELRVQSGLSVETIECIYERVSGDSWVMAVVVASSPLGSWLRQEQTLRLYGCLTDQEVMRLNPEPDYLPSFQRCVETVIGIDAFVEEMMIVNEGNQHDFPMAFITCTPSPWYSAETIRCIDDEFGAWDKALPLQHEEQAFRMYGCLTDEEAYAEMPSAPYPPSFQRCAEEKVGFEAFLRFMTEGDETPSWFFDCFHLLATQ